MPEDTADIVGDTGSEFEVTLTSGTVVQATLNGTQLTLQQAGRVISLDKGTVPGGLPRGDSEIDVTTIFAPGDADATIGVGTIISGHAEAAETPGTLDHTEVDGTILLFGKQA